MNIIHNIYIRYLRISNPVKYAKAIGVKVGKKTNFVTLPSFGSEPYLIRVGNNTNISSGVSFVTHDGGRWVLDHLYPEEKPFYKFGRITIGNNCFIGMNTIIMPNVSIADHCVIGAGSVVTKNIPSGQVWAGCPARYICSIEEYKNKIQKYKLNIDWSSYRNNKERELKRIFNIK